MLHISFALAFSLSFLIALSLSLALFLSPSFCLSLFFASVAPFFALEYIQSLRYHRMTKIWTPFLLSCLHLFCFCNFPLLSAPFVYIWASQVIYLLYLLLFCFVILFDVGHNTKVAHIYLHI